MTRRAFALQMLRDPADVVHQRLRVGEYTLIDSLQDKTKPARSRPGIDDEGLVDVATAEAFRRFELASKFEAERNVPQISDRRPPHPTTAQDRRPRHATS